MISGILLRLLPDILKLSTIHGCANASRVSENVAGIVMDIPPAALLRTPASFSAISTMITSPWSPALRQVSEGGYSRREEADHVEGPACKAIRMPSRLQDPS